MNQDLGKKILDRFKRLQAAQSNFTNRWDLIARYFAPTRYGVNQGTTVTIGENILQEIYDSTGHFAADLFGNFVSGKVISRADKWFDIKAGNPLVAAQDEVKEWCEFARDVLLDDYSNSNFYPEATEQVKDYGVFATGCLFGGEKPILETDPPSYGYPGSIYQCNAIGRYVIAENGRGEVDTLMYEFKRSARAAAGRWKEAKNLDPIKTCLEGNNSDREFDFVYAVQPRDDKKGKYGNKAYPYSSCYVFKQTGDVLEESGFRRFPYTVARYGKRWGEYYGRGFGELALHDAQSLNAAKRLDLEAMALNVRKPIAVSSKSVTGTLLVKPAASIPLNTHGRPISESIMVLPMGEGGQFAQIKEEELRKTVLQMFYVAQILQMLEIQKAEMTAFEFGQKLNLLYGLLGPVYGGMESGFLKPRVEADFMRLYENKVFGSPPDELLMAGGQVNITFQNPLAKAQKMGDADAINMALGRLGPIIEFEMRTKNYSEALDMLDFRKAAKTIFDVTGTPAKVIRNDKELQAIDQARANQTAQEKQIQGIETATGALQKAAPMVKAMTEQAAQ